MRLSSIEPFGARVCRGRGRRLILEERRLWRSPRLAPAVRGADAAPPASP